MSASAPSMLEHFRTAGLAIVAVAVACEEDDHADEHAHEVPECIEFELDGCTMLYPPTYDQVWSQTMAVSCGSGGSACHPSGTPLTFMDPQTTWQQLIDQELVVPGDPTCSHLFVRLATDDPEIRMPPGSSGISAEALCSIGTWIADGAEFVAP